MTDSNGWQRTSSFAAIFYIGRIYRAIARNAVQSLAPLAALLVAFRGDSKALLVPGLALFVIGTFLLAFLRWWFFRFRITPTSVLIRQGVFRKTQLDIRFERVQAINTRENLVFRLLGLLTVSFDTAGSQGQEGYLPAVGKDTARELRNRIRRVPKQAPDHPAGDPEHAPPAAMRTLMRLTAGDMVRIGLSSNRVFLVLVLLGPISDYLEQDIRESAEERAIIDFLGSAQEALASGMAFGLLLALALLVAMFAISIVGAFLRWHRFELVADDDVLRSTGGLFTRHEHSVNHRKVQSLQASQHLVLRWFRRYRLRARQASVGRAGRSSDFIVPVCTAGELALLGREIYADEFRGLALDPGNASFRTISPYYLRSRILLAGVLPAVVLAGLWWPAAGPAALLALLWLPVAATGVWQKYRRFGLLQGEDGLAFRSGLVGYRVVAWLHRKVQRISITQSPFQRRKELATVRVYLAAGTAIRIPYMEYAQATALRDYVLYRVESSRTGWH